MTSEAGSGIGAVAKLQERYRVLAKLGSGGMADVFLGVQLGEEAFQQLVVIKRVHSLWLENQNALQMFISEARTVASLNHPHIVKIIDLSRLGKDVCIVMEYVNGENLDYVRKAVRKADARIPLPIVCKWMVEASDALHYAHAAKTPDGQSLNLIHRDIGPHNLMTDNNGYLKVIDFGIAKSTARSDLTTPGMIKGKFSYLAPDLFTHERIDGRADLYALGLVFHELLTRTRCCTFKKDVAVAEVLKRVTTESLPPPSQIEPDVPAELDRIVLKALAKDREQRYQTGEQLAADVRRFAEGSCGLAASSDVEAWYQQVLSERCQKRREFEARALEKAKQCLEQESGIDEDGPQMSGQFKTSNLSPVTGVSQFQVNPQATASTTLGPAARRGNPYLLLVLAFILFAGGAVLVHQLFFAGPGPDAPVGEGSDVVDREAQNLLVRASEPDAEIHVDGKRVGLAGANGLALHIEPGREHSLEIAKEGFEAFKREVRGESAGQRVVQADLVALVRPDAGPPPGAPDTRLADADPPKRPAGSKPTIRRHSKPAVAGRPGAKPKVRPAPKAGKPIPARDITDGRAPVGDAERADPQGEPTRPEPKAKVPSPVVRAVRDPEAKPDPATRPGSKADPPGKSDPQPAPAESKPKVAAAKAVALFSGDGTWSGAQVANTGCARCHGAGKAPALQWGSKTARQWKYFFRRKRHNRHAKLEDHFSTAEIKRVVAFILKQLADEDKSGIAGVK